ncbi:MAG TPA: TrmH family RNA methyltransferase [Candidatus Saccharimonadales bacterium]|nr:TrmH family RNA methyltransferase [Candidatus Saccharimonadales bacterium]
MRRNIVVIAHNLRSAHNVGSLIRTCEGLGVDKIFFTGYTPYPQKPRDVRLPHISRKIDKQIDKTALGAQDGLPWDSKEKIGGVIKALSEDGYTICALEQAEESTPLSEFDAPHKVALIIGNEVRGLEKEVLDKADTVLEIPMFGKKESFNAVQAAAMALYRMRFH